MCRGVSLIEELPDVVVILRVVMAHYFVDVCRKHPRGVPGRLVVVVGGRIASERRGRRVGGRDRFGLESRKDVTRCHHRSGFLHHPP